MDLEKIESALKKILTILDRGVRLEAVFEKEDACEVILAKGTHSDQVNLSRELLTDFLENGKGGGELKKDLGKVISKLNRMGQRRG